MFIRALIIVTYAIKAKKVNQENIFAQQFYVGPLDYSTLLKARHEELIH